MLHLTDVPTPTQGPPCKHQTPFMLCDLADVAVPLVIIAMLTPVSHSLV